MGKMRWIVGAGAMLVAATAFYVLMGDSSADRPALDDIDAKARAEMRDLLRSED